MNFRTVSLLALSILNHSCLEPTGRRVPFQQSSVSACTTVQHSNSVVRAVPTEEKCVINFDENDLSFSVPADRSVRNYAARYGFRFVSVTLNKGGATEVVLEADQNVNLRLWNFACVDVPGRDLNVYYEPVSRDGRRLKFIIAGLDGSTVCSPVSFSVEDNDNGRFVYISMMIGVASQIGDDREAHAQISVARFSRLPRGYDGVPLFPPIRSR